MAHHSHRQHEILSSSSSLEVLNSCSASLLATAQETFISEHSMRSKATILQSF